MKRFQKFAVILLMAVLALTMLTACGGGNTAPAPDSVEDAQKAKVIAALNKVRVKNGLEPLEENEDATAIAEKYTELYARFYYADNPISKDEYDAGRRKLRKMTVDGRNSVGHSALFASVKLPADEWNEKEWESNGSIVVLSSTAKWVGFAFVQRTSGIYKGRYVCTIIAY